MKGVSHRAYLMKNLHPGFFQHLNGFHPRCDIHRHPGGPQQPEPQRRACESGHATLGHGGNIRPLPHHLIERHLQPLTQVQFDDALAVLGLTNVTEGARSEVSCDQNFWSYLTTRNNQTGEVEFIEASTRVGGSTLVEPVGTIRYTIDGSTPSAVYGRVYDGCPLSVCSSVTIRAVAWMPGRSDSPVAAVTSYEEPLIGRKLISPLGPAGQATAPGIRFKCP